MGSETQNESRAMASAAIGAGVGLIGGWLAFGWDPGGIATGVGSKGTLTALIAIVVAGPVFAMTYVKSARQRPGWSGRGRFRRILDVTGLSLSACAVLALLIASVYQVFQLAFRDLVLDPLAATALAVAIAAASSYAVALLASDITTRRLASLLALFLAAGTFASMLTAEDPRWWENNFSALGMGGAFSSMTFNLTVILAGLVVVTLADYIMTDLRARRWRGRDFHGVGVVKTLLVVVGLAFVGIGLVPVDASQWIHNLFSITLIGGFSALIGATPALLKGLPRSFAVASGVFLALMVAIVVLWVPIGYYNLTAVELLAVVVVFSWLVLFARSISADEAPEDAVQPVVDPVAAGFDSVNRPMPDRNLASPLLAALLGALVTAAVFSLRTAVHRRKKSGGAQAR